MLAPPPVAHQEYTAMYCTSWLYNTSIPPPHIFARHIDGCHRISLGIAQSITVMLVFPTHDVQRDMVSNQGSWIRQESNSGVLSWRKGRSLPFSIFFAWDESLATSNTKLCMKRNAQHRRSRFAVWILEVLETKSHLQCGDKVKGSEGKVDM